MWAPSAGAVPINTKELVLLLKTATKAAWAFLRSPQATRLEIALFVGLYEAVRAATGHA